MSRVLKNISIEGKKEEEGEEESKGKIFGGRGNKSRMDIICPLSPDKRWNEDFLELNLVCVLNIFLSMINIQRMLFLI